VTATFDSVLSRDLDQVRLVLGDTDTDDPLLQDETVQALLDVQGDIRGAILAGCEAIVAQLAREVSTATPPLTVQLQQRYDHYQALLTDLRGRQLVAPFAGGTSVVDKMLREANPDRVGPSFTRDQFDFPSNRNWPGRYGAWWP
jgi:hypothetical protein